MSFANGYPHRPPSNVGYGQNHGRQYDPDNEQFYGRDDEQHYDRDVERGYGRDVERGYGRDVEQGYGRDYRQNHGVGYDPHHRDYNYQQPYVPRRRHTSHNNYPASQVIYSNNMPRYVTGGDHHHHRSHHGHSHHGHSRHAPNVVIASSRDSGHQATPYIISPGSSGRYRAVGHRSQPIPVVTSVSYRNEWVPLSTRIRRLFGLGPPRSSTHIGKSVHVKRWGFGRQGYNTTQQYTTANYGGRGSQSIVYTI